MIQIRITKWIQWTVSVTMFLAWMEPTDQYGSEPTDRTPFHKTDHMPYLIVQTNQIGHLLNHILAKTLAPRNLFKGNKNMKWPKSRRTLLLRWASSTTWPIIRFLSTQQIGWMPLWYINRRKLVFSKIKRKVII